MCVCVCVCESIRLNLKDLSTGLNVFYVVHSEGGKILTPLPAELAQFDMSVPDPTYWKKPIDWVSQGRRNVDYVLVDKKVSKIMYPRKMMVVGTSRSTTALINDGCLSLSLSFKDCK